MNLDLHLQNQLQTSLCNAFGQKKLLVIGEDWCPDVYRGMTAMAKMANVSNWDMRIFFRDQNLDIIDEFLSKDGSRSIPVAVFYTSNLEYICHWIERPEIANQERVQIFDDVKKELPNADEREIRKNALSKILLRYSDWQKESVNEMIKMLAEQVGIVYNID